MALSFILLFLCLQILAESSADGGNPCTLTNSSPGICTSVNNCQAVLKDLMAGSVPDQLCGYANYEPIICCPTSTPTTAETLPPARIGNAQVGAGSSSTPRPVPEDQCTQIDGSPGICRVLNNCQSVLQEFMAGKVPDKLCGFSGKEPIVCCPTNTIASTATRFPEDVEDPVSQANGAIARRKCRDYARYVYTSKYPLISQVHQSPINVSRCAISSQKLVTGGTRAERMEFPHMAAVGYNMDIAGIAWHCGGTLISETCVLTAAHCVHSSEWGNATWVRVGDLNLVRSDDGAVPVDRRIIKRIIHPGYKPPAQYHDIAILRLEAPVPFNSWIRPACLHTASSTGTTKAIATGWGHVKWTEEEGSNDLLKVTLPLVDQPTCNASYYTHGATDAKLPNGVNGDWTICAGELDRDTCQGDAGGPLVIFSKPEYHCMYDVVGVTSLGKLCGSQIPGIYTRVYNYISWIEDTVWRSPA